MVYTIVSKREFIVKTNFRRKRLYVQDVGPLPTCLLRDESAIT